MSWFERLLERWHEIGRQGAKRQDEFIRKYFDLGTWAGIFRGLLLWGTGWYVLWNFYDIMDWFHDLTGGRQYDPVTPGQIRWIRLCASVMCFPPILLTILALIILPITRYRARKYAQKQAQKTDTQADDSEKPRE